MKSNYWRTAPKRYIDCMTGLPVEEKKEISKARTQQSPFRNYEKYVVRNLETGKISTAVIFTNGKVAIGDDVWRLSNRADMCECPFRTYLNKFAAEREYDFLDYYPTHFTGGTSYAVS